MTGMLSLFSGSHHPGFGTLPVTAGCRAVNGPVPRELFMVSLVISYGDHMELKLQEAGSGLCLCQLSYH